MKNTGMTRPLDGLGRVVLPKEIRNSLGLKNGDKLEISLDGGAVCLRPVKAACAVCGCAGDLVETETFSICRGCLQEANSKGED